jgi:hypothetical protein
VRKQRGVLLLLRVLVVRRGEFWASKQRRRLSETSDCFDTRRYRKWSKAYDCPLKNFEHLKSDIGAANTTGRMGSMELANHHDSRGHRALDSSFAGASVVSTQRLTAPTGKKLR